MLRGSSVLAAALLMAAAACDATDPVQPTPSTTAASEVASPTVAAASFGAMVEYDAVLAAFAHFDAKRGLMSVHGIFPQICQRDPLTLTPRMIVTTHSTVGQQLFKLGEGEQPVVVYRTSTGALSCALINSPQARVASGSVRHSQVFTLASFTATWRGPVTAPDGSTHYLTEEYQLTADLHDPNNPDLWSLNASKILIH